MVDTRSASAGTPVTGKQTLRRLATAGNPNIGKTTLINAISGADLQVGNWPGTTVDRLQLKFILDGAPATLVDLPGTYSLAGGTSEEAITRHELLESPPDVIVNVVDGGNLERNLYLTLELCEMGMPMVVVLNLLDEARRKGITLDVQALERELGVPVIGTVATRAEGVEHLYAATARARIPEPQVEYTRPLEDALARLNEHQTAEVSRRWLSVAALCDEPVGKAVNPTVRELAATMRTELEEQGHDPFLQVAEARFARARQIVEKVASVGPAPPTLTSRLDRVMLNRWLGIPLFLIGMMLVFRFTFLFSTPWIDYMEVVQGVLSGWTASLGLPHLVESLVSDGLVAGVGTILAFAPVLFCLYMAMSFLESSGFLARASFVCDKLMKFVGLPGRAFIPLLLGFGCNVPAIYATRTLGAFSDRLRVSLAIPFMACSARLTVFTLFAAVFFPKNGALVVFGLYLMGLVVGLLTALMVRGLAPGEGDRTGVMEMPPYRLPHPKVVLRQAYARTAAFVRGAGGAIMGAVLVVWLLLNLPAGNPQNSYYARVSQGLVKVLTPIGLTDWRLAGALIPGFIAKEVVVGTLGVSYLGSEPVAPIGLTAGLGQLWQGFQTALGQTAQAIPQMVGVPPSQLPDVEAPGGLTQALAGSLTPAAALAYMVFVLLYTPCVATVYAIRQEFGRRWAAFSLIYQLVAAYALAWLTFWMMS